jgi:1-acyl-sn-glycerol-3-phosphate acyltransferase
MIAALFGYGLFAVTIIRPLLQAILRRRAPAHWNRLLRHWYRSACRVMGIRIAVFGEPSRDGGLTVANHISWIDIIAIGSVVDLDFIAKEDVRHWPVVGYLANSVGTLFARRGDSSQLEAIANLMTWRIHQGRRLMLFPEGTTTRGDRVLRFNAKLFKPAHLAGAPVQAVALRYRQPAGRIAPFVGDDDFLSHLWRVLQLDSLELELHFCEPIASGWLVSTIAPTTRNQIVAALGDAITDQTEAGTAYFRPRRAARTSDA